MSKQGPAYARPERRRRLILDVPLGFGAPFTAVLIAVILVNLILLGAFLLHPSIQGVGLSPWYPLAVAAVEALLLAVALLFSVLTGKRILGPVLGVRRVLRSLAAGDLSQRVAVRDGEYFEDLIAETNQSLDALEARIRELRESLSGIDPYDADRDALAERLIDLGTGLHEIGLGCDEGPRRSDE